MEIGGSASARATVQGQGWVVALMLILEKAGPRGRSRFGMVSVMGRVWMGEGHVRWLAWTWDDGVGCDRRVVEMEIELKRDEDMGGEGGISTELSGDREIDRVRGGITQRSILSVFPCPASHRRLRARSLFLSLSIIFIYLAAEDDCVYTSKVWNPVIGSGPFIVSWVVAVIPFGHGAVRTLPWCRRVVGRHERQAGGGDRTR